MTVLTVCPAPVEGRRSWFDRLTTNGVDRLNTNGLCVVMLLCALPGGAAYAQAYPHKPIRMINPFSPSGAPGRAAFSAMIRGPGIKAVGMRAD